MTSRRGGAETQHAIDIERQTVAVTFDQDQDNFAPGGSSAWARANYVPLDPDDDNLLITGFEAPAIPVPSDFVLTKVIHNTRSDKQFTLPSEDSNSDAANRILFGSGADHFVRSGHLVTITYVVEELRWRVVSSTMMDVSAPADESLYHRSTDGVVGISSEPGTAEALTRNQGGSLIGVKGGLAAAIVWPAEASATPAANTTTGNWNPLAFPNYTFNMTSSGYFGISTQQGAAGMQGKIRVVQDGAGGRTILGIGRTTGFNSHFEGGTIFPGLLTGSNEVTIYDWYTPDQLNFYFSLWGSDMQIANTPA